MCKLWVLSLPTAHAAKLTQHTLLDNVHFTCCVYYTLYNIVVRIATDLTRCQPVTTNYTNLFANFENMFIHGRLSSVGCIKHQHIVNIYCITNGVPGIKVLGYQSTGALKKWGTSIRGGKTMVAR